MSFEQLSLSLNVPKVSNVKRLKKVRSPLRYPGGKSRALKYIIPLVPEYYEYENLSLVEDPYILS